MRPNHHWVLVPFALALGVFLLIQNRALAKPADEHKAEREAINSVLSAYHEHLTDPRLWPANRAETPGRKRSRCNSRHNLMNGLVVDRMVSSLPFG